MADGITVTSNMDEFADKFRRVRPYVEKQVKDLVSAASIKLDRHITQDLFQTYPSGTTGSTLSTRSGILKKSIKTIPPVVDGTEVKGGVTVGTVYSPVHFGKSGQVTTISPKRGKYLAIPLPDAMNANGVAKGGPRDESVFGSTFVRKSKAGNLIIFGKTLYVKGKKAGQEKGALKALFILKSSVKVQSRITPESLQEYAMPIVMRGLDIIRNGLEGASFVGGSAE